MDETARPAPRPFGASGDFGQLASDILSLSGAEDDLDALISRIVLEVHRVTGFECVGLRLKDGEDYPYYFTQGFDESFVKKEMFLCARDGIGELIRDSSGHPYLECMCGNIIAGRTDPRRSFFTSGGSFWSNHTTELLATTTDEDRQARTRNRCNSEGYETVALVPLKLGGMIYGLLQLNDRRLGELTPSTLALLEGVAICIAMVFRMRQDRLELQRGVRDLRVGLTARTAILQRIALELRVRNAADRSIPEALLKTLGEILDDLSRADGIVSICAACKRVRQAGEGWYSVEQFIADRSRILFSHGYCPACYQKAIGELDSSS
jgi:hypothetical protein